MRNAVSIAINWFLRMTAGGLPVPCLPTSQKEIQFQKSICLTVKSKSRIVEVCRDQINSVKKAQAFGADRIELCSALKLGGITPDISLFQKARETFQGPIHVLIRPRDGDFHYDREEKNLIMTSAHRFLEEGADGLVVGGQDGEQLDLSFLAEVRREFPSADLTCHRVFDVIDDQHEGLRRLMDLGYNRVLTSGQKLKADHALSRLRELFELAANDIVIMPGSGVHSGNVLQILSSGPFNEIHLSAKRIINKTPNSDLMDMGYYELEEMELQKILKLVHGS